MIDTLPGSCLCGAVTFEVKDEFTQFHLCHCQQCQKVTGSAHASNAFTKPENIQWLSGVDQLKRYDIPGRSFTKVFCATCGSGLPFMPQSGKTLIVPVGSLSHPPTLHPQDHIFWSERLPWFEHTTDCNRHDGFPP
ncbi:MAG: hypothetical protein ACI9B9_001895 [Halioglobus sp.]|jgi:hypothetical protein